MGTFLKKIKYFIILISLSFLSAVNSAYAVTPLDQGFLANEVVKQEGAFGREAGFDTSADVGTTMAAIIKTFLGLLGIIFIILIITAGYKWMTAQGNEEKINEAKDTIKRAIIGLIIIVSAYAITYFVFTNLGGGGGGLQYGQYP